jgi:hypothetical protein
MLIKQLSLSKLLAAEPKITVLRDIGDRHVQTIKAVQNCGLFAATTGKPRLPAANHELDHTRGTASFSGSRQLSPELTGPTVSTQLQGGRTLAALRLLGRHRRESRLGFGAVQIQILTFCNDVKIGAVCD